MALDNLISIEFSDQDISKMTEALTALEDVMRPKAANLTPEQRQELARVRYEMIVWIGKVGAYMLSHPQFIPSYVDTGENTKDRTAHTVLDPLINRTEVVLQMMLDTSLLLGADIYHNAMSYYRTVKAAARDNAPGASAIYADLKQQFPGGRPPKDPPPAS